MEDPYIREEFEATLRDNGGSSRMEASRYVKPAGTP
jgi:hypothetical protein